MATTYRPDVVEMLARHAKACEFTQAVDHDAIDIHLRTWIEKCGGPSVKTNRVSDWSRAARAARAASAARDAWAARAAWAARDAWAASAASAAWAARDASAARAARAAWAAWAASAAWAARAASAASAAWDARDARDASAASAASAAWTASWIACAVPGAIELQNHNEFARWMPTMLALESGAWLWWVTDREVFYVPLPEIYHIGGRPHRTDGPALISLDWTEYFLDGILVDEQIVMRPETQTIQQINSESNNDVRAIRCERYGWEKYLLDSGAKCIDERKHPRDETPERLYRDPKGDCRIIVVDPSTRKSVVLGVPADVKNCAEAQNWMSHGFDAAAMVRT